MSRGGRGLALEGALVAVVAGLGELERLWLTRVLRGPARHSNNWLTTLRMASLTSASKLERDCSRLRRAILICAVLAKRPAAARKGWSKTEGQRGSEIGIEVVVGIVGRDLPLVMLAENVVPG